MSKPAPGFSWPYALVIEVLAKACAVAFVFYVFCSLAQRVGFFDSVRAAWMS